MARKVLGQASPAATTATDLYTVGVGKTAVVSTLAICNTTSATVTYRAYVRVAGASVDIKQYLIYDAQLGAKASDFLTLGLTLGAGDVITIYSSAANVAFSAFGDES